MGCKKCKNFPRQFVYLPGPPGQPGAPGSTTLFFNSGPIDDTDVLLDLGISMGLGISNSMLEGGIPTSFVVVPQDGTLNTLTAELTLSIEGVGIDGTADITITVYTSPPDSNTWSPTTLTSVISLDNNDPVTANIIAGTKIAIVVTASNGLDIIPRGIMNIATSIKMTS